MGKHWLELAMLIAGKQEEALEVIRSAREQDPRSPLISSALAHHYYYRRNFDDAIREYHHAIELDSAFLVARLGLGMTYSAVGQHQEAIEQANAAVDIAGEDVPVVRSVRAFTLARAGKTAEARAMLAQLERDRSTRYIAPHFLALVYAGLGDDERALTALEEAFKERSGAMLYLTLEPPLERLYEEPRFRALVQRVHR
jgi:tetratricopeptide (TPR) repeat protein